MKVALLAAANSANTASWARGLKDAGHDVTVLTFHPGVIPGIPALPVGQFPLLGKLRYLTATFEIRRLLQSLEPDIVIGYYLTSYGLAAALAWHGPLVLAAAGSDLRMRHSAPVLRFLAARGDLFLAWARHMADRLESAGVDRNRILTLHRGIDLSTFSAAQMAAGRGPVRLISTRSLKPVYGIGVTIEAVAELIRQGRDLRYTIVGDGPLRASLETLAENLAVSDRISFVGRQPPECVAEYLRASDVYISMSSADGASSSLFEAMACGVFPVVSDLAANREWIEDGRNGIVASGGSSAEVASAIGRAIGAPELRQTAVDSNLALARERFDRIQNLRLMSARLIQVAARGHRT